MSAPIPVVMKPGTTDITAITQSDALTLFPNPNQGIFTVKGNVKNKMNASELKLQIVDVIGRVLYEGAAAIKDNKINQHISVANFPQGIYILRIAGEEVAIRFIIEK
jgi:hypothetical protein